MCSLWVCTFYNVHHVFYILCTLTDLYFKLLENGMINNCCIGMKYMPLVDLRNSFLSIFNIELVPKFEVRRMTFFCKKLRIGKTVKWVCVSDMYQPSIVKREFCGIISWTCYYFEILGDGAVLFYAKNIAVGVNSFVEGSWKKPYNCRGLKKNLSKPGQKATII